MPVSGICQSSAHKVTGRKAPHDAIKPADSMEEDICFPLQDDNVYSLYSYIIDLQDPLVIRKYSPFFRKYDYMFSGYVWEGLLKEMINGSGDKELIENVFIKSQSGLVGFTFTKPDVSKRLPAVLCPIFNNPSLFERFIKTVDRRKIKNY